MAYFIIGFTIGFIASIAMEILLFYLLVVRRNC
jgi:hypothetical protein